MRSLWCCAVLIFVLFASCAGKKTAVIWTDRPEFAFYSEHFNTSQDQYKVTVKYHEFPAIELTKARNFQDNDSLFPDIIIGSWLKNDKTGTNFKSLDNLFGANKLSRTVFYQRLLAVGRIESKQYLLPVSFNVPMLIFARDREQVFSNQFTIGFDEIKELSKAYNVITGNSYTRMGFSPLWNNDFLMTTAILFDVSFREASPSPAAWDDNALERAMNFIYNWTHEVNTSSQAEEDFTFKYFFEPPEKLIQSGRIFFSYMESDELFTLSEDSKNNLDFRWIIDKGRIPISDDAVYLGLAKRGKAPKAARAFIQWFFNADTQRQLMDYSKTYRISESVFGIAGGFSALSPVTEQVFPLFYPALIGHMPSSEYLMPPNVLPGNWVEIKERVILPYLQDRARTQTAGETLSLERRLADWQRMNR